jgi:hypothetical protein
MAHMRLGSPSAGKLGRMPELDFAFMCDYARAEGALAHVIAAGIDTVQLPATPTGANFRLGTITRPRDVTSGLHGRGRMRWSTLGGRVD